MGKMDLIIILVSSPKTSTNTELVFCNHRSVSTLVIFNQNYQYLLPYHFSLK